MKINDQLYYWLATAPLYDEGSKDFFQLPTTGQRPSDDRLAKILKDAVEAAGIDKNVTTHILRHTWATHQVLAGTNLRVLQALGGWKDLTQLKRYSHLNDHALEAAADRLNTLGRRRLIQRVVVNK